MLNDDFIESLRLKPESALAPRREQVIPSMLQALPSQHAQAA